MVYISQKLSEREAWYSTVNKECLAIQWVVDSLRYYLLVYPFTLWAVGSPVIHHTNYTFPISVAAGPGGESCVVCVRCRGQLKSCMYIKEQKALQIKMTVIKLLSIRSFLLQPPLPPNNTIVLPGMIGPSWLWSWLANPYSRSVPVDKSEPAHKAM